METLRGLDKISAKFERCGAAIKLCSVIFLSFGSVSAATPADAYGEMERGNYTSAAAKWQSVIASEPEYVLAINYLGYCEMMLGNYKAAVEHYIRADAISQSLDSKAGAQWAYLAAEQFGESIPWGKAALKIDPQNYGVKYRLAIAQHSLGDSAAAERSYGEIIEVHGARSVTLAPRGQLIPYYQAIQYTGSTLKSSGFDAGIFALWNLDSGMSAGAGYAYNQVENPKSSDPYNTSEIRLLTGFLFKDLSSLTFNSHILASDSSFLNRGVTLSATYRAGFFSGLAITADALIFPQHKGGAVTPMYYLRLSRHFELGLGATGQVIGFSRSTQLYGAAQATLRYCVSIFCAAVGGLYGSLFTPLLDSANILAYNPDDLTLQGYTKLSLRPMDFIELSAAYSLARWKAINGETPVSGIFSIAVTGSLK